MFVDVCVLYFLISNSSKNTQHSRHNPTLVLHNSSLPARASNILQTILVCDDHSSVRHNIFFLTFLSKTCKPNI